MREQLLHTVHVSCYACENSLCSQYLSKKVKALIARTLIGNTVVISILKISTYFIIGLSVSIYDTGREKSIKYWLKIQHHGIYDVIFTAEIRANNLYNTYGQ